jgi:pyruvate kinase
VFPFLERELPENWNAYLRAWLEKHELRGDLALLTEGPSLNHPEANHRMEIIDLKR